MHLRHGGGGRLRECGGDGGLYSAFMDSLWTEKKSEDDLRSMQACFMRENRTVIVAEAGGITLAQLVFLTFGKTIDEYATHVGCGKEHSGNLIDLWVMSRQGPSSAFHAFQHTQRHIRAHILTYINTLQ